jgi:hypothetical protein
VSSKAAWWQGNGKVNSKTSCIREFYKAIKSQISSTKLQINLKLQNSMTKTFTVVFAPKKRDAVICQG